MHKETVNSVPNSLSHRNNCEIEIYGTEGIPPEDVAVHEKEVRERESKSWMEEQLGTPGNFLGLLQVAREKYFYPSEPNFKIYRFPAQGHFAGF